MALSSPEDWAIVEAFRLDREMKQREALGLAWDYTRELGRMARGETIEAALGEAVIEYQAIRESLPLAGDSKRKRRLRAFQRAAWATSRSGRTVEAALAESAMAIDYLPEMSDEPFWIISHSTDEMKEPELLFEPDAEVTTGIRQGWVVGYPDDREVRGRPDTIQFQIGTKTRSVVLESGFAVRNEHGETLTYHGLHEISAQKTPGEPAQAWVTEGDRTLENEELLFPLGLVLEATRAVARKSPYPDVRDVVKGMKRRYWREIAIYSPEILVRLILGKESGIAKY